MVRQKDIWLKKCLFNTNYFPWSEIRITEAQFGRDLRTTERLVRQIPL